MPGSIRQSSTFVAATASLALLAGGAHAQTSGTPTNGAMKPGTTQEQVEKKDEAGKKAGERVPMTLGAGTTTTGDYATKFKEARESGTAVPEELVAEIQKMGATSEGRNTGEAEASKVRPGFTDDWTDTQQSAIDAHAQNVLRNAR